MHRLVSKDGQYDEIVDLSEHSWYFVYEPNDDPKPGEEEDESRKRYPVEEDESTETGTERDIFDAPEGEE